MSRNDLKLTNVLMLKKNKSKLSFKTLEFCSFKWLSGMKFFDKLRKTVKKFMCIFIGFANTGDFIKKE